MNEYAIEIGPMGPIGEHGALILRATKNCPWNRCLFCSVYKGRKFGLRSVSEIKKDIDTVKRIEELISQISWQMGMGGKITRQVISRLIKDHPKAYQNRYALMTLNNVLTWISNGKRRCFLQDANSLIMRPDELIEVLRYIKESFPSVHIISTYARSKTCAKRSLKQLKELKEAGLSWAYVGIESGSDRVLRYMKKGVSQREHIEGGQKMIEAGINYAAFVMPGLGGKNLSKEHVNETLKVLNEIKPTEIRIRSLAILENSPLYQMWKEGEFEAPTEDQMIDEIEEIIKGINFDCIFETLQMTNFLFNIRGRLSHNKEEMLNNIAMYKSLPLREKLKWKLSKYLYGGYLSYVEQMGKLDSNLERLIQDARKAVELMEDDAEKKVEYAILAIKSKGIP